MNFFQAYRAHSLGLILFLAALFSPMASGETGRITGVVQNRGTREPLALANVQLLSTSRGTSTDFQGNFDLEEVPVGTYQVQASLVGFRPTMVTDVVVATGKPAVLVLELEEDLIGVDAVEVTASYFRRTPDAPVSIQRLSFEEIRRSPGGFEDVVRAVSVLPGVAQAEPGRNDLVVRGGAPSENLFVVDNIEIPNINHFGTQGASGGPLSYINLDYVRETSFSTGGFGVRYGDRLSSVLTIDLKEGRTDRLGGKATVSATQFGLNVEGPITERGSFILSARRSYLDFIFKASGFSFVPEYWDFLSRGTYSLDTRNRLTFLAIGAIDDVAFFNRDAEDRFDNSRVLGTAQRQYAGGIIWQHLFGNGFSTVTLGRTFVQYNGTQRDSLLVPVFSNRSKEAETSLRGDLVLNVAKGTELSFGAQLKYVGINTNLALPRFVSSFGDTLALDVRDYQLTGYKSSAYSQISQRVHERVQLTLGGRADYYSLINESFYFSPRASAIYDLSQVTSLTASAGVYYQSPSYVWLAANSANRDLRATRVNQYIVGLEHLLRADLKVRVEGFVKRYSGYPASLERPYLVLANTGGGYGGSDENFASFGLDHLASIGTGRCRGVELLLQKKLSEVPLYGLFSVTLSQTRFAAADGIERPGAFDQELIVNLSGGYRFDDRWEASMKFRYASGRPYTPFDASGRQTASLFNSARVPSLHSLDLRVDRRWNFTSWNLIAYLDVQNVYNKKLAGTVRWNVREQRAEIGEGGIGILPSIGLSAEF